MRVPRVRTRGRAIGTRKRRFPVAIACAVATVLTVVPACARNDGGTSAGTASPPGSEPTTTPTRPRPLADQTPPMGTNGLAFDGDRLWVADSEGGQILAIDPDTGTLFVRWRGEEGVTGGVKDLAVGPDGVVYWTGFDDGSVGRMSRDGVSLVIAGLEPGASAIAFAREPIALADPKEAKDGRIYVSRAGVKGDGLWEIDPRAEKPVRLVASTIGKVNAFDIGADGWIYAAQTQGARLVKISPTDGEVVEIVTGVVAPVSAGAPPEMVSAKLSPDRSKVYVLSRRPTRVSVVDLATRAVQTYVELDQNVDSLAVAPDGRLFVSGGPLSVPLAAAEPLITVIGTDRSVRTVRVGTPAPT